MKKEPDEMKNEMNDKEIDKLFHDRLGQESIAPPAQTWEKIEMVLDGKRKSPTAWVWWLSGLLIVAALNWWIWFPHNGQADKNKIAVVQADQDSKPVPVVKDDAVVPSDRSSAGENGNTVAGETSSKTADASVSEANNDHATNGSPVSQDQSAAGLPISNDNAGQHSKTPWNGHRNPTGKWNDNYNDYTGDTLQHNVSAHNKHGYDPLPPRDRVISGDHLGQASVIAPKDENSSQHGSGSSSVIRRPLEPIKDSDYQQAFIPQKKDSFFIVQKNPILLDDDTATTAVGDPLPPAATLPSFFAGVHGGIDNAKMMSADADNANEDYTNVNMYGGAKTQSLSQTYSAGARFGWFFNKRFSLDLGFNYSIYSMNGGDGTARFNHNNPPATLTFHTAASSVTMPSSALGYPEVSSYSYDTLYFHLTSSERYDYYNVQLGLSYYIFRATHFGVYADVLSNTAFLAKQQLTLTSTRSGKTFNYDANDMSGMKKAVMGAQSGVGIEYCPVKNFGIWAEPALFFSSHLNSGNTITIHPYATRYIFGLMYHF